MLYLRSLRVDEGEVAMATRDRLYTVDDAWRLACAPENEARKICLIDGELLVTMSPGQLHGTLASEIARLMGNFVVERDLGRVTVETGYHPAEDRHTVLIPDVAFEGRAQASQPAITGYAPYLPDLAVEITSPSQSLAEARRKAETYLRHGAAMVWLVHPAAQNAEVWTAADDSAPQSETIKLDGELTGGTVLPGFTLPLSSLFPV